MRPVNGYHRTVCGWLSELGLSYTEEYDVSCLVDGYMRRYSADIYLPELRMLVEIDGPMHMKKRDAVRDEHILEQHELPTLRIKVGTRKENALEAILGA